MDDPTRDRASGPQENPFRAEIRQFVEEHGAKARFTGRSRLALTGAQQEAQQRGHDFLGSEHLLVAVMRDETSVASLALRSLGTAPGRIRAAAEALLESAARERPGIQPEVRAALERADTEARLLGHAHIGTEHLLLGLLWPESGNAARILASFSVDLERARGEVLRTLEGWQHGGPGRDRCGLRASAASSSIHVRGGA
jgi:ATP-dependent Clp protease ATP-binding subunit ClpC